MHHTPIIVLLVGSLVMIYTPTYAHTQSHTRPFNAWTCALDAYCWPVQRAWLSDEWSGVSHKSEKFFWRLYWLTSFQQCMAHGYKLPDEFDNNGDGDEEKEDSYICPDPRQSQCNWEQPNNAKSFPGGREKRSIYFHRWKNFHFPSVRECTWERHVI